MFGRRKKVERSTDPGRASRPQCEPLNEGERAYLADQLSRATGLVRQYVGREEAPPSLGSLDRVWATWQKDADAERIEANAMVNAVGAALGQHLAQDLHLGWTIITDDFGTDLGLFSDPGAITVFPVNMLAKRIDEAESPVSRLYGATRDAVARTRAEFGA